jgi:hypothetical protein
MFRSDLSFGQVWEKKAIELLEDGCVITPPEGVAFSDWDFQHNGTGYEVKADRRAWDTGNLAIEYEHTRKPSGLSITKADFYIYFMVRGNDYRSYKIPVEVLRSECNKPGVRKWYTDGGNSQFYLINCNTFSDYLWKQTA